MLEQGSLKSYRAKLRRLADDSFKGHVVTPMQTEGPVWMWKCSKPGTWCYGFYVVTAPGMVMTYGDTPEAILRVSTSTAQESLSWLLRAVRSDDYVIEKMVGHSERRVALQREANRVIWTLGKEKAHEVLAAWNQGYETRDGRELARALYEVTGDAELFEGCQDHAQDVWYAYHALRHFARIQQESAAAATVGAEASHG